MGWDTHRSQRAPPRSLHFSAVKAERVRAERQLLKDIGSPKPQRLSATLDPEAPQGLGFRVEKLWHQSRQQAFWPLCPPTTYNAPACESDRLDSRHANISYFSIHVVIAKL